MLWVATVCWAFFTLFVLISTLISDMLLFSATAPLLGAMIWGTRVMLELCHELVPGFGLLSWLILMIASFGSPVYVVSSWPEDWIAIYVSMALCSFLLASFSMLLLKYVGILVDNLHVLVYWGNGDMRAFWRRLPPNTCYWCRFARDEEAARLSLEKKED
mgnify:CR=1 FL=1